MSTPTPAGWYPDPADPSRTRWWDGAQWTENVSGGQPPAAPAAPAAPAYGASSAAGYPAYPSAPAYATAATGPSAPGVSTDTVWAYLAILVSFLPVLSVFFIDWNGMLVASMAPVYSESEVMSAMGGFVAQSLLISVFGYAMLALSIVFSWLDWRELKRRGVARPFHWAYSFFALLVSITVYIIGRTVVVKRETGKGLTVLWVWIASVVLAIVITVIWSVNFFNQMMLYMQYMSY
ncbi:DUF2510 domain-containing protein [Microbacterium telephonicum]|uniref:Uncharacterized protein DUF2510 n=1 Tax=Microbacterium telephonicum TaxID=1714841 RepID=A0A498BWS2_9MICO|nr:DUF2510 domain-containing protein [Microbacterium telephonicum]RLK47449.1 uncharacterized protein DUF2510 [Microbacterium telephonicum]